MQRLRRNHGQRPPVLPQLRQQALSPARPAPPASLAAGAPLARRLAAWLLGACLALLPVLALTAGLVGAAAPVRAAEVLQITGPDRLLIGDRNRSTVVRLGCLVVEPENAAEATELLRRLLPRHRRVNLRPLGVRDGELLARLSPIDPADGDPAEALVAAGLASPVPCA